MQVTVPLHNVKVKNGGGRLYKSGDKLLVPLVLHPPTRQAKVVRRIPVRYRALFRVADGNPSLDPAGETPISSETRRSCAVDARPIRCTITPGSV